MHSVLQKNAAEISEVRSAQCDFRSVQLVFLEPRTNTWKVGTDVLF